MNDQRWGWMRLAVDQAKASRAEVRDDVAPRVGVTIAKNGQLLGSAHRGKLNPGDHAEFCLLTELADAGTAVEGAEVFTTLEPCTRRSAGKIPCAERLISAGVAKVWIGSYDPNPSIYREGWRALRDAGIELGDFPAELRAELRADNYLFFDRFRLGLGASGGASFDPAANSGEFVVEADGHRVVTSWSRAGSDALHAYRDCCDGIAHARYAQSFDQIDDPGALDFSSRVVSPSVGEIVVFRRCDAYLLVHLLEVHDAARGADRNEARIEWQLRVPGS